MVNSISNNGYIVAWVTHHFYFRLLMVLGRQLFTNVSSTNPQMSFGSLWEALLTVFTVIIKCIVVTGDNWGDTLGSNRCTSYNVLWWKLDFT